MREIIQEARNVEEAINLACQALGVERDVIEFEIISLPKRGFLGLRNTPAKVRVSVEEPEEVKKPAPRRLEQAAPKMEKTVKQQPKPEPRKEQPRAAAPAAPAAPAPKQPAPQAKAVAAEKPAEEPVTAPVELKFVSASELEGKAKTAADYVYSVLNEMGIHAEVTVAFNGSGIVLRLSGDGLGVIIGRRGETLDSLQYLAGLVANREEGDYMRVTIDSGNYREKRERTLEQLARKLSASAVRYGRASTLEPMNPYERRIIHATVSKIEGVSSTSIGEEPNRRVVISPTNLRPQQNRGPRPGASRGPRSGGDRGGRPPRRDDGKSTERRFDGPRPTGPRPPMGGDRGPRREFRDNRAPGTQAKPTPTSLDREYAKEIEREAPVHVKPESTPAAHESTAPARPQALKEGDDLPLYGKIDL